MKKPTIPEPRDITLELSEHVKDLLAHLKKFPPFPPPHKVPFHCAGFGVDFQTYPLGITPGPLVANTITFTDDDHVSGPAPTPTRIQIRAGYIAFHCGYLLTIDMPPTEVIDLVYFDGGGIIDYYDPAMRPIYSKHVPNVTAPTTETFYSRGSIARVEIRSANEMYLLQVCCRKG